MIGFAEASVNSARRPFAYWVQSGAHDESGPQSKAHDAPVCLWPEPRESQALVPARERIVFRIDGDEHTAGALASVPCLSDCHHNKRLADPASLIAPIHAKLPEQVAPDRRIRYRAEAERGRHSRINSNRQRGKCEEADNRLIGMRIESDSDAAQSHRLLGERARPQE